MDVNNTTPTTTHANPVVPEVPSTKGHRPWKQPKTRPGRSVRRTASLKLSLEDKQRQREKRETLRRIVQAAREADAASREAERKRIAAKRKLKQDNELRGTQPVVITNPKKLAKMSKKQYLNYVKRNKVLN